MGTKKVLSIVLIYFKNATAKLFDRFVTLFININQFNILVGMTLRKLNMALAPK